MQNDNVINTNEQVNDIQNGIQEEVLGLMLTVSQGYLTIRGPGLGWQSDAFNINSENTYSRCPVIQRFGALNNM